MNPIHLHWKSNYEIGIEEIDFQHHCFINLINRLGTELINCTDNYYQNRLLQELFYYAKFHFISEENIMMKYHYPYIERHKELHLELIDELNSKNATSPVELLEFLIKWFVVHTAQEDKKFGEFINATNSDNSSS